MLERGLVLAVGFDLDGTLYEEDDRVNDIIRCAVAKAISGKFRTEVEARVRFDERYEELQSGRKVLAEMGFEVEEADGIMNRSVANADIAHLLKRDDRLAGLLEELSSRYFVYLVTHSPKIAVTQKLESLGINRRVFRLEVHKDLENGYDKQDGSAFRRVVDLLNIDCRNHVFVGNSRKIDILPAKMVGMQTIAVWSEILEASLSLKDIYEIGGVL